MPNTTWNPADLALTTLSGGNLTTAPTGQGAVRSIYSATAGKWYFEIRFGATGAPASAIVGIANSSAALLTVASNVVGAAGANGAGSTSVNGTAQTAIGAFSNNGTCCIAMDMGGKLVWFRNGAAGNWNGSGTANPATGVGGYSFSGLTGGSTALYALAGGISVAASGTVANFGDSAFVGTAPAGFNPGFGATTGGATQTVRVMVLA